MEKKRPVGVKVIGWILIIISIYLFLLSIGIFSVYFAPESIKSKLVTDKITKSGKALAVADLKLGSILMGGIAGIFGLINFIPGLGILKFKNWARIYLIILITIAIIWNTTHLSRIFTGTIDIRGGQIITVLWSLLGLIVIYYLTRPKVKEQFK